MQNYTIYRGRFKIDRFRAEDVIAATMRFDLVADKMKNPVTLTLYQGKRSMENMCVQFRIS